MCVKWVGQRFRLFSKAQEVDGQEIVELGFVDNDMDGMWHTGAVMPGRDA